MGAADNLRSGVIAAADGCLIDVKVHMKSVAFERNSFTLSDLLRC